MNKRMVVTLVALLTTSATAGATTIVKNPKGPSAEAMLANACSVLVTNAFVSSFNEAMISSQAAASAHLAEKVGAQVSLYHVEDIALVLANTVDTGNRSLVGEAAVCIATAIQPTFGGVAGPVLTAPIGATEPIVMAPAVTEPVAMAASGTTGHVPFKKLEPTLVWAPELLSSPAVWLIPMSAMTEVVVDSADMESALDAPMTWSIYGDPSLATVDPLFQSALETQNIHMADCASSVDVLPFTQTVIEACDRLASE